MPKGCAPIVCLLLLGSLVGTPLSEIVSNSSTSSVVVRHEMTLVMSFNTSIYKEALRVLEIDDCRAAVHKADGSKASFLLEPLLCWQTGMEKLLCPGFDYMRSRHFLRVPVLLADPTMTDRLKRRLQRLYPTSLSFMNTGAIRFRLVDANPGIEVELENQLGAVGGKMYLLLRAYCTSLEHCRDISRGLVNMPSLFFEKIRISLNSSEYSGLQGSARSVSAGQLACQNDMPQEASIMMSGIGGVKGEAAADNHTKVVEVDGQLYILVQQRSSGRVSFQRDWSDYENGFGNPRDDYWMGLRLLHTLTKVNRVVRVEIIRYRSSTFNQDLFHSEYTNLRVGPPPNYVMTYSAWNKAKSTVSGDALSESRGRAFSTRDRDNDRWGQSCSRVRGGFGGWWFNSCGKSNPNGVHFGHNARNESGIRWEYLDSARTLSGNETLRHIRILLRI